MGRADTHPGHTFGISEHLFRLTTESLRLYSNETYTHQTLENLIDARSKDVAGRGDHDRATLNEHLTVVPTTGPISITVDASSSSIQYLDDVRCFYGEKLGVNLTLGDALSLTLFDYVVEQKADRILKVLEVDRHAAPRGTRTTNNSSH